MGISLQNPVDQIISFSYAKWNGGGHHANNLSVLMYLDNNDSYVLAKVNDTILNHTAINNFEQYDWTSVSEGDHLVSSYVDYGQTAEEMTATINTSDNLKLTAVKTGIFGNRMSLTIENDTEKVASISLFSNTGSGTVYLNTTAGLVVGDSIVIKNVVDD